MMKLESLCIHSQLCILKCRLSRNLLMFKIVNRKLKKARNNLFLIPGHQRELQNLKMPLSDTDLQPNRFLETCLLGSDMVLRLGLLEELALVNQLQHKRCSEYWSWRKAKFLLMGLTLVKLNFKNSELESPLFLKTPAFFKEL